MPVKPEVLTANREAVAWLGSLDVSFTPDEEPWFTIDGVENPQQIGSDGSSGTFVLLPSQNVLYISSEGRAGIIAGNFEAFIQLVVAHPYWLDILKFSALVEMRRAADALEATLDDEDDINEARSSTRQSLLPTPSCGPPTAARSRRCSTASASTTTQCCATRRRESSTPEHESGERLSPGCLPLPDGERSNCPWRCEASSSAIRMKGRGVQ
ncbi:hypothetical protein [Bradyrhizobium genosp. SA-3]|uniref:hypothetical protein n=1 Tax=Bradyrhizobium genosp. SA-3 TaxID=508868 RepID=UPI001FDF22AF|nr:hypothetical protein [Bradyrhizobium genosp. SA-3]